MHHEPVTGAVAKSLTDPVATSLTAQSSAAAGTISFRDADGTSYSPSSVQFLDADGTAYAVSSRFLDADGTVYTVS